ncbi:MAG: FlgD immunoglobulin-like domain containing protein [Patescibacteria group bacterium]|nr:FlgD immunoglobulin-like domain containing protein [Patescibacteria group bacterium]
MKKLIICFAVILMAFGALNAMLIQPNTQNDQTVYIGQQVVLNDFGAIADGENPTVITSLTLTPENINVSQIDYIMLSVDGSGVSADVYQNALDQTVIITFQTGIVVSNFGPSIFQIFGTPSFPNTGFRFILTNVETTQTVNGLPLPGRLVTVVDQFDINVTLSTNTPPSTIISAGSTNVDFLHVRIYTGNQNAHLNQVIVSHVFPNINPENTLTNIRMFCGNTQYGTTAQGFDQWNEAAINNCNLYIPAGELVELCFVADVGVVYGNGVSFCALQLRSPCIVAADDNGEIMIPVGQFPITGNYMQINQLPEIQFYISAPDTLYVLPGEWWYSQHGIRMYDDTPIIAVDAYLYWDDLSIPDNFQYNFNYDMFHMGQTYEESGQYQHRYRWYCNNGEGALFWWLLSLFGTNMLPPGDQSYYSLHITTGTSDLQIHSIYLHKYIVTIDRIRGDINDDGICDALDVNLITNYHDSLIELQHRYTESGLNYGAGCIMFDRPGDVLSNALMHIHSLNPQDDILDGLGIGELMSTTAYGSPTLQIRENTQQITGNILSIETTGNIVDVNTVLENGEPWRYTGFVENGFITIPIPNPDLEYKVETRYWQNANTMTDIDDPITPPAESPVLNQNYPNPFNIQTSISYTIPKSGNVQIEIYNVKGQLVKTLVSGDKTSGDYSVTWNGTDQNGQLVSQGIYFYKMVSGKFSSTKKMILMK